VKSIAPETNSGFRRAVRWQASPDAGGGERRRRTVSFTRAAGLVKKFPPQEQLQARVTADFERRQPRRVQAVVMRALCKILVNYSQWRSTIGR
jgi:hypothetical protein